MVTLVGAVNVHSSTDSPSIVTVALAADQPSTVLRFDEQLNAPPNTSAAGVAKVMLVDGVPPTVQRSLSLAAKNNPPEVAVVENPAQGGLPGGVVPITMRESPPLVSSACTTPAANKTSAATTNALISFNWLPS